MSIAILIPENWEPAKLVLWSTTIARAKGEDLLIIRPKRMSCPADRKSSRRRAQQSASPFAVALREQAEEFEIVYRDSGKDCKNGKKRASGRKRDDEKQRVYVTEVNYADLVDGVLKEIRQLRVVLLIVPRHRGVRISEDEFAPERQLFLEAPCETLLLRPGKSFSDNFNSILVANSGSKRAVPALNFGATCAAGQESKLTALYVKETDTAPARQEKKEQKQVQRRVRKSLKEKADVVVQHTVVDEDVPRGVSSYATAKGHDVVIVGAGGQVSQQRLLPASVPEKILADLEATVIVVRQRMPLVGRVLKTIEHRKKNLIPQLDREGRIQLVERVESGATWDFDFCLMMFLATMLASLGLVVDSPPVVIGAMLVAPLMGPILGLGVSVVQGNRRMANVCMGTVGRGFAVAFMTGCFVGVLRTLFASGITQEMSNRGAPGVLDLFVAFVSGIVAAYAFGRPHLLSVLPGIAIATSLVPPVATAGLSLFAMDFSVALGASLLFLSNAIAIVLGAASALWIVGMRGPREICPFSAWARKWMFGLLAVTACLAVFFSVRQDDNQALASPVSTSSEKPAGEEEPAKQASVPAQPPEESVPGESASAIKTPRVKVVQEEPSPSQEEDVVEIRIVLKPAAKPDTKSAEDGDTQAGKAQTGETKDKQETSGDPPKDEQKTKNPPAPEAKKSDANTKRRRPLFFWRRDKPLFRREQH